ncbi:nickel-dependent lactate racemase [bacterium]|nr:nickel-dependent lactate racemase [bacterium]
MGTLFIKTLNGRISFELPSSFEQLTFAKFEDRPGDTLPLQLTETALKHPIASPNLHKRLTPEDTVSVIIEDLTRNSPKKYLLQVILTELESIGIADKNIKIIIALGTHRALSRAELEMGYGKEIVARYTFINHDCQAGDLVRIGELDSGTPVKINRHVAEATYRIGIGSIFPHPMNGFGGGCKILFPGVADMDSILEHHLKYSFVGQSFLGNLAGNEFHRIVNELAKAGGLDFILNSVLDHNDQLVEVVCGEPVLAHLEGARICRETVSRSFNEKADLTIISTFPYSEGPQMMKPFAPAAMITRKNGVIILVADCTVPLPDVYFETCEQFQKDHIGNLADALLKSFADNRPVIKNAPPELNMSLAQVMLTLNDFNVIIVTRDITEESVKRLGCIYADNIESAILQSQNFVSNPTVHVIPSGGIILPVVGINSG